MRRFALLASIVLAFGSRAASAGWTEQKSQFGDGNNNFAVSSGDCKSAVVVGTTKGGQGDQAVLWLTTDGGTTWNQGQAPQSGMMAFWIDVWMTSAGVGYLGGMDLGGSSVMMTTNGGSSWQKVPSANASQSVTRLFFGPGGTPGFALGDKLAVTSNGAMWQTVTFDAGEATMGGIMFPNAMEGYLVGGKTETDEQTGAVTLFDEGTVMRSTDGGLTWSTIASKQPYSYGSVWFPTPALGFLTGFDGSVDHLFQSADHGATWTEVALPAHPSGSPIYALTALHFSSTTNGWLVGAAGQEGGGVGNKPLALHTTDGGQTWAYEDGYDGSGGTFFDVWACNDGTAFFVGDWGKIDKWSKEGYVAPDGAEVIVTESGEVIEPAGPWADVLGGFRDGQVLANGGQDDATGGGEGATLGDGAGTTTKEVCTTREVPAGGGCAMGAVGATGGRGALLALLGGLAALVAGRRRPTWARRVGPLRTAVLAVGVAAGLAGCGGGGGTTTEKECKTVTVQTTFDFDTTGGGDGTEPSPAPTCLLIDAAKPEMPAVGGRVAWTNPFLAFARTVDGVDQVVVTDPDGDGEIVLTGLEQGGARVLATGWSPDRTRVAFLSDFWADHSTYRTNVFVAGLDPLTCFMSTPNAAEGVVGQGVVLRLQGFLKGATGGGGALVAVPDATVGSTRGGDTVKTNQGGGYVIDLPGGDGTLVFRRVARDAAGNEDYWGAVVPYLAAGGMQQSKDAVGRQSGGNTRIDAFTWKPDGTGFSVVVSGKRLGVAGKDEAFTELSEYDAATGAFVSLALPADLTGVRRLLPPIVLSGGVRVLPWVHQDHSGKLTFVFGPGEDGSKTIPAPGLFWDDATRTGSRVVVSPADYLAWVTDDGRLALLGADEAGQLEQESRDAFPGLIVVPDELDWSPDGLRVVVTTRKGDAVDLYVVDVNTLEGRALTTDGASHAPAWYGR